MIKVEEGPARERKLPYRLLVAALVAGSVATCHQVVEDQRELEREVERQHELRIETIENITRAAEAYHMWLVEVERQVLIDLRAPYPDIQQVNFTETDG